MNTFECFNWGDSECVVRRQHTLDVLTRKVVWFAKAQKKSKSGHYWIECFPTRNRFLDYDEAREAAINCARILDANTAVVGAKEG